MENHDIIEKVQGTGQLLSIILKDDETARKFCEEASKTGLLCAQGRVNRRSVILRPALMLTNEDVEKIVGYVRLISQILTRRK